MIFNPHLRLDSKPKLMPWLKRHRWSLAKAFVVGCLLWWAASSIHSCVTDPGYAERVSEHRRRHLAQQEYLAGLEVIKVCRGEDFTTFVMRGSNGRLWVGPYSVNRDFDYITPLAAGTALENAC